MRNAKASAAGDGGGAAVRLARSAATETDIVALLADATSMVALAAVLRVVLDVIDAREQRGAQNLNVALRSQANAFAGRANRRESVSAVPAALRCFRIIDDAVAVVVFEIAPLFAIRAGARSLRRSWTRCTCPSGDAVNLLLARRGANAQRITQDGGADARWAITVVRTGQTEQTTIRRSGPIKGWGAGIWRRRDVRRILNHRRAAIIAAKRACALRASICRDARDPKGQEMPVMRDA